MRDMIITAIISTIMIALLLCPRTPQVKRLICGHYTSSLHNDVVVWCAFGLRGNGFGYFSFLFPFSGEVLILSDCMLHSWMRKDWHSHVGRCISIAIVSQALFQVCNFHVSSKQLPSRGSRHKDGCCACYCVPCDRKAGNTMHDLVVHLRRFALPSTSCSRCCDHLTESMLSV